MPDIDYEFMQGVTWYAVDPNQRVAAFDLGAMPRAALDLIVEWKHVDDVIRELPDVSKYELCLDRSEVTQAGNKGICRENKEFVANLMMPNLERFASELPRRGIYQFKGVPSPYGVLPSKYRLIGVPLVPICLQALPGTVQGVISIVAAPVQFDHGHEVDVSTW